MALDMQGSDIQMGIYVALVPAYKGKIVDHYQIHVVNYSDFAISIKYHFSLDSEQRFACKNRLSEHTDFYLNNLEFVRLNDGPVLEFDVSILIPGEVRKAHKTIRIKPKDLSKQLRQIPILDRQAYLYKMIQLEFKPEEKTASYKGFKIDPKKLKKKMMEVQDKPLDLKDHLSKESSIVVDIHIEKLIDDHDGLSNSEILDIQLKHFRIELEHAIKDGIPRMYVIHGIGKGKLKETIFKLLEEYEEVKSFENSYDKRFGFGATEIIFE